MVAEPVPGPTVTPASTTKRMSRANNPRHRRGTPDSCTQVPPRWPRTTPPEADSALLRGMGRPATGVDEDGDVLGHIGINVPDLAAASAYYGPLMPLLAYEPFFTTEDALAFMPAEGRRGAYLFLYEATVDKDYTRERPGCNISRLSSPPRTPYEPSTRTCAVPPESCSIHRRSGLNTRRPTSPRSGSIRSGSCSRPSATTTARCGIAYATSMPWPISTTPKIRNRTDITVALF